MFTVYILYSEHYDKTYVGYSSNIIQRFHSHNSLSKKGWTILYRPWVMIHCEYFESKTEAMNRESTIKSGVGREWIARNIGDFLKAFE